MSMVDVIEGISYPRLDPIACPLCEKRSPARVIAARFGMVTSVAECHACRLAYQTPKPSEDASRAYMNWRWSSSDSYVTDSESKRRVARAKLEHVHSMRRSPGRLLDFGAGSGTFVHASRDAGWQAVGVELGEPAIERAKEYYGIELLKSLPDEEFDVITMWDVVEHLRDPAAVLQELHGRLRRDGLLLRKLAPCAGGRALEPLPP